ncbi:MAG: hypothetical protein QOH60_1346 [Mycobacterium sp.]|jgi:hypothetical protein|nr:hypothetical protein [Mycobacterium sp.]
MPKWWPANWGWGRSKSPAAEPTAAAVRREPAWHRLPSIQRTVGDIEPTAQFDGFTESLTTSQNPGLTDSLDLLSAGESDSLSVLPFQNSAGDAAPQTDAVAAPTPQSRTWGASPAAVQRALRQPTSAGQEPPRPSTAPARETLYPPIAPVQRAADVPDVLRPVREVRAVDVPGPTESAAGSMMESPEPEQPRMLEATSEPVGAAGESESLFSSDVIESEKIANPVATEHVSGSSEHAHTAQPAVAVQRLADTSSESPAPAVPLRQLSPVQRDVVSHANTSQSSVISRPLPQLPTIEPASRTPGGSPKAPTSSAKDTNPTLQRASDPPSRESTKAHVSEQTGSSPATPTVPTGPAASKLPAVSSTNDTTTVMRSAETPDWDEPSTPPTAQRLSTVVSAGETGAPRDAGPITAAPSGSSQTTRHKYPAASETPTPPTVGVQRLSSTEMARLPVVDASTPTRPGAALPRRRTSVGPALQRVPEEPRGQAADSGATALDGLSSSTESQELPAVRSPLEATREFSGPPSSDAALPFPSRGGVVQRSSTQTQAPPQAGARRLVVLPPVRNNSQARDTTPSGSPITSARSVIADAPRTVGLQRMFGQVSDHPTARKEFSKPAAESDTFSPSEYGSDAGHFQDPGYSHDLSSNTITFSPPTIQREPDSSSDSAPAADTASAPEPAAPAPAPASAAAASTSSVAAAAGAGKELDVDNLVNNIYDTLAARLRAELWLDRERAGALMDLGR